MKRLRLVEVIKKFFRQDSDYYKNNKNRIQKQNSGLLRISCLVYLGVLLFYTLMACLADNSQLLIHMYIGFDIIHIVLTIFAFTKTKDNQQNRKTSQVLCYVLEVTILMFFAIEGVFPYPNLHSFYFPIPILLIMLLFIHKAKYIMSISFAYIIVYAIAAFLYKKPEVATYDLYIALATLIFAFIGCILVSKIRHKEGLATQRLEYLCSMDEHSGTYNKQTIETICKAYIADTTREKSGSYAIMAIDLDDFKSINDKYGHNVGDEVIAKFGRMLKSIFYEKDNVGRFGGDEFLVLMVNDAGTIEQIQKKLISIMAHVEKMDIQAIQEKITCCIGVAFEKGNGLNKETYEEMFARADKSLYEAKAKGKNQYIIN